MQRIEKSDCCCVVMKTDRCQTVLVKFQHKITILYITFALHFNKHIQWKTEYTLNSTRLKVRF